MRKILLIKHGALGDLVQADGILRDIRAHFADAELVLLTGSAYQQMMQQCPHIDTVLIDNRKPLWHLSKQWQLFKSLQQHTFDLVIDLQNSDRSRYYRKLFFPKTPWIGRPASAAKPISGLRGLAELLQQHQIPVNHTFQPDVSWMTTDVSKILHKGAISRPYIALIPGCSAQHPEKRWPYYAELATQLLGQGYQIINILGPDEQALADSLPGYSPTRSGKLLSWFELAGILKQAAFIIGNDTGPSHIASCLKRPGLAIFGPATSASRAEIERGSFKALNTDNLQTLTVAQVLSVIAMK